MLRLAPLRIVAAYALAFLIWIALAIWEAESRLSPEPNAATGNPEKPTIFELRFWIDDPVAIFTLALTLVTAVLVYMAWRQERHFKATERSYVKISHNPPGVRIEPGDAAAEEDFFVQIQVKNHGRTPARVTDFVLTPLYLEDGERPPVEPPYERGKDGRDPVKSFLVISDEFYILRRLYGDIEAVEEGRSVLWLFGYVDYIDSFGVRHRGGYGRFYKPRRNCRSLYRSDKEFRNRSNLFFISEDAYNYDRPRRLGEGNDW